MHPIRMPNTLTACPDLGTRHNTNASQFPPQLASHANRSASSSLPSRTQAPTAIAQSEGCSTGSTSTESPARTIGISEFLNTHVARMPVTDCDEFGTGLNVN